MAASTAPLRSGPPSAVVSVRTTNSSSTAW